MNTKHKSTEKLNSKVQKNVYKLLDAKQIIKWREIEREYKRNIKSKWKSIFILPKETQWKSLYYIKYHLLL